MSSFLLVSLACFKIILQQNLGDNGMIGERFASSKRQDDLEGRSLPRHTFCGYLPLMLIYDGVAGGKSKTCFNPGLPRFETHLENVLEFF